MKKLISYLFILLFSVGIIRYSGVEVEASGSIKAGIVNLSSGKLNVRTKASITGSILSSLNKGDYLTLINKEGDWWYVEFADGKYGYCHEDFVKETYGISKYVNLSYGSLNVRKGDGTEYSIKDSLNKGERVIELWTKGSWSYILYDGNEKGFVSTKYLSSGNTESSAYGKISLNVPDFKQTDSRWSGVKLGASGKTIGQIGCTTTGISMMESYRKGYNIYPNEMAKRLSYTSSGNLYWPSDYKAVTSKSGYLERIYNLLKEGKPVLFGGKNSYGSQHWIVITGFKGGDSLIPSSFTINDPGSNINTTHQDYLKSYPIFYKFFYY